jgi:hypothetical protein
MLGLRLIFEEDGGVAEKGMLGRRYSDAGAETALWGDAS